MKNITQSDIDRFVEKVEIPENLDDCFIWTASSNGGYGQFVFDGKNRGHLLFKINIIIYIKV